MKQLAIKKLNEDREKSIQEEEEYNAMQDLLYEEYMNDKYKR